MIRILLICITLSACTIGTPSHVARVEHVHHYEPSRACSDCGSRCTWRTRARHRDTYDVDEHREHRHKHKPKKKHKRDRGPERHAWWSR